MGCLATGFIIIALQIGLLVVSGGRIGDHALEQIAWFFMPVLLVFTFHSLPRESQEPDKQEKPPPGADVGSLVSPFYVRGYLLSYLVFLPTAWYLTPRDRQYEFSDWYRTFLLACVWSVGTIGILITIKILAQAPWRQRKPQSEPGVPSEHGIDRVSLVLIIASSAANIAVITNY